MFINDFSQMITSCCSAVASEAQFLFPNFGGDRFTDHWKIRV